MSSQAGRLDTEASNSGSLKASGTRSKYSSAERPPSSSGTITSHASASPSASSSANGYAARHAFKDSAANDGSLSRSPTGTSHGHSGRNMAAGRRASVNERHVTDSSYGHKRAASGDVGAAWSVEASDLGSPASPATNTPHGRHSQAQSYSQRHGSTVAAAEHSTGQLSRTSSSSTKPSPRLSRSPSNKLAQLALTASQGAGEQQPAQQQQQGQTSPEQQQTTAARQQTAGDGSASTTATVISAVTASRALQQGPDDAEASAAAAALAAQVAAGVAAAVRSGTLSRNSSQRQTSSATAASPNVAQQGPAAVAATAKSPALPFLQTGDLSSPATAATAGSPGLVPQEPNGSLAKDHSSRLWGFGSPKKEKSNSKVLSSDSSPAREKSAAGSRLWGHDSPLRRDKSSKRLSNSRAAGAAAVEPANSSDSGALGSPDEAALHKQSSKNKLWSSEAAARAVASIFGSEGFNALRKSLSGSGRAAAAAVAAVDAADAAQEGLLRDNGRAEEGTTAAAVASILAADADSGLLNCRESSRSDAGLVDGISNSGAVAACAALQQQPTEHRLLQQPVEDKAAPDPAPAPAPAPAAAAAASEAVVEDMTTPNAQQSPPRARNNSSLSPAVAAINQKPAVHSPSAARMHLPAHKSPRHGQRYSPRPAAATQDDPLAAAATAGAATSEDITPPLAVQPAAVSLAEATTAAVASIAAEEPSDRDSRAGIITKVSDPASPEVPDGASARSPLVGTSSDYRYSELLFRLQQFLPALKNAGTEPDDFEATWELLKSELTCLVSTARIASLQASRLEALDAEVTQLQRLLVEVGRSIKGGAQQQQLQQLVQSFPSFAQQQINSEAGSTASTGSSSNRTPASLMSIAASKFPAVKPAAAAAAGSPISSPQIVASSQQETVPSVAPAAGRSLVNTVPPSSSSTSTTKQQEQVQAPTKPAGIGRYAVPASDIAIGRYTSAAATGVYTSPESSYYVAGSTKSPAAGSSSKGSSGVKSPAGGSGRSVVLPPPPKELTPDEAAQLVGLYRAVRNDPERISYKTLKVPSKQSSPASHPDKDSSPHQVSSPLTAHNRSPTAAAAALNLGRQSSPQSDIHGQRGDPSTARLSADYSVGLVFEPSALGGEDSSGSSSWDYAHIGSAAGAAAGTGVAKGFRILESIPEAHKRVNSGVVNALTGTTRREDSTGMSPPGGSTLSRMSPNRRASSPNRTSISGDDYSPPGRGSPGQRHSRMSSSSSDSLVAVTSSGNISKGVLSPGSPAWRPAAARDGSAGSLTAAAAEAEASSGSAALMPSISSPTIGVYGYDYVRARSASPNLGLHYLDRSPIFKARSPASPGSSAIASPRRPRAAGSVNALPPNMSALSIPIADSPTAAGAVTAERSLAAATADSSVVLGASRSSGAAVVVVLADDPAFRSACQAFREQQDGSPVHSSLFSSSTEPLTGSAKLVAKLSASPAKDADSGQVDAAMNKLSAQMRVHGVPLEIVRLGPLLYSVGGRKLRLRMRNGKLLVRTGGGCMDLLVALGKLPVSGNATQSPNSSRNTSSTIDSGSLTMRSPAAGSDVATSLLDGANTYGLDSLANSPSAQLSVAATGPGGSPRVRPNNLSKGICDSQTSQNLGLYTFGPLPDSSGGGIAGNGTPNAQITESNWVESAAGQGNEPAELAGGEPEGDIALTSM